MRMTNKIMQNNSLYNINNNKVAQDRLSTMMATQKKITKPSDDPVIAIRALRLRTSVSEMTQYYEKNAPDAESWLDVTAQALKTTNDVLTSLGKLANKGNNKDLGSEDLQVILGQMKSLRDEFYSTGNTDYAGRYIFTGFRTDTTLTFKEDVEKEPKGYPDYRITEPKSILDFDTLNYTYIGDLGGLNKNNIDDAKYDDVEEKQIKNGDIHRLRLAYDTLDANNLPEITIARDVNITIDANSVAKTPDGKTLTLANPGNTTLPAGTIIEQPAGTVVGALKEETTISLPGSTTVKGEEQVPINGLTSNVTLSLNESSVVTDAAGTSIPLTAGSTVTLPAGARITRADGTVIQLSQNETVTIPADGSSVEITSEVKVPAIAAASVTSTPDDPYEQIRKANETGEEKILFVPETGEILFSNAAYEALAGNVTEDSKINVNYSKNSWKNRDLRPEHYFACTKTVMDEAGKTDTINYNFNRFPDDQKIEYDVGYNQKIQVNTMANEVFTHGLDRDIDDLERTLNKLTDMDATRKDLEAVLKGMSEDDEGYNDVRLKYEAADKAYSYMRENVDNMFGTAITKMQGYLNDTNEAVTDNGTRSQRLDLISNRLMDQRSNFQSLKSENEDIDIAEVVIQLTSTELTYNAALMATGKIMQTSLMNYI